MIKKFFSYFFKFITNPSRAGEEIAGEGKALFLGFWIVFLFGFLYSITVLIYYLLGHGPVTQPFLPIPHEKWYLVQAITTIPVTLTGFLTIAGLFYIMSKAIGGKGTFDATAGCVGYGGVIPWFFTCWIYETFVIPFLIMAGTKIIFWPQWVEDIRVFYFSIGWTLIILTLSLARAHKISWWKSLILVLISIIPAAGVFAVFVR